MHQLTLVRSMAGLLVVTITALLPLGCAHPYVRTLEAFQAARKRGDEDKAAACLAPDARSWWEKKEGPGSPLTAKKKKGRWADWDHYFHAKTQRGQYVVDEEAKTLSYPFTEINDFYRLIDRPPTQSRYVYYFDDEGKICGKLFEPMRKDRPKDRFDEFKAWAKVNRPKELAYLMPKGDIIPDLARAKRWRELLTEWRRAVALPPIRTPD